ncbi:hypothetical protein EVAR_79123_1 [Eumeta japonica]|uniref:Uncharacterized protein n=1 Tax=Eumeta variegata TaxID=151549 RepID=A0A4C1UUU1_EUMVA|nr:hypothetical protein EVAR_79123_1 [Eumeta japonica]
MKIELRVRLTQRVIGVDASQRSKTSQRSNGDLQFQVYLAAYTGHLNISAQKGVVNIITVHAPSRLCETIFATPSENTNERNKGSERSRKRYADKIGKIKEGPILSARERRVRMKRLMDASEATGT